MSYVRPIITQDRLTGLLVSLEEPVRLMLEALKRGPQAPEVVALIKEGEELLSRPRPGLTVTLTKEST